MNDLIEKLSILRSQFNCFNKNERDAYHTLSEAIKVLSERPELCEDAVSRRAALDSIRKCTEIFVTNLPPMMDKSEAYKAISKLPSAQPDWNEMIVMCDCCGHAIHVKRIDAESREE